MQGRLIQLIGLGHPGASRLIRTFVTRQNFQEQQQRQFRRKVAPLPPASDEGPRANCHLVASFLCSPRQ